MQYARWIIPYTSAALMLWAAAVPARAGESWVDRAKKLSSREVTKADMTEDDEERDTRNLLSIRRIRPSTGVGDWNTDPTAIPFMLYQVKKRTDLPVYVDNAGLDVGSDELFEQLVVYITSHEAWSFNETESDNMTKWLKRGGTFFLDDCYNRGSPFADTVGPELGKMLPETSKPIMLLRADERVKDVFNMVYKNPYPGSSSDYMRPWQYYLLDGRPAVFFTPNDDGCAWEVSTPPTASNPIGEGIGHGGNNKWRELVYQWTTNWMMFVYTH